MTPPAEAAADEARLDAVVRVLAVAVLACLACSWRLWLSTRRYPLVPLLGLVPPFPWPFDAVVLAAFAGLLVAVVLRPRSRGLLAAVGAGFALLFAQDRSRMWPSFYEFFLLVLVLLSRRPAGGPDEPRRLLAGLQFVVAAVYFWGGVQKLTPEFFHGEFPWFVAPLAARVPAVEPWLPGLAVVAAVGEALCGVGLLTRFRGLALGELLVMHAVIGVCIGPLRDGWNVAAWLWSLASAVLAWLLFRGPPGFRWSALFAAPLRNSLPQLAAVVLVGILPVLDNLNRWDSALSFNVYTGNVSRARILLSPEAATRLPAELAAHVSLENGRAVLDLDAWAMRQFNAGVYPARPVFAALLAVVCGEVADPSVRMVVVEKSGWGIPRSTLLHTCGER